MAELVYDPLELTRQLEATGVPRDQAEVHAKFMTTQYLHMVESLATRDYLDARLAAAQADIARRWRWRQSRLRGGLGGCLGGSLYQLA
jgi:hypothetical protein